MCYNIYQRQAYTLHTFWLSVKTYYIKQQVIVEFFIEIKKTEEVVRDGGAGIRGSMLFVEILLCIYTQGGTVSQA